MQPMETGITAILVAIPSISSVRLQWLTLTKNALNIQNAKRTSTSFFNCYFCLYFCDLPAILDITMDPVRISKNAETIKLRSPSEQSGGCNLPERSVIIFIT